MNISFRPSDPAVGAGDERPPEDVVVPEHNPAYVAMEMNPVPNERLYVNL